VVERTRQLQQLVRRVLTAQEEERNRIALELHDETAQIISTITFTLGSMVRKESGLSMEDASRLREARDLSGRLLEGIRRLISALRPAALTKTGLGPALRSHAGDLFGSADVGIHIVDHTMGSNIPDYVELVFYRIGQEALNNVAKHSNCSDVWVEVSKNEAKITMTIQDNGIGFDVKDVLDGDGRGIGLIGMRERAGLIDGEVKIDSMPGEGSTVEIQVSIEDDD
jgi:two-component system sensor histidine kinase UhpB